MKDLVVQMHRGDKIDLKSLAVETLTLPETATVHDAIARFRSSRTHIALVVDEYGSIEGIITHKDILEAIVGILPEPNDDTHLPVLTREDGSLLLDGLLPIYEVETLLEIKNMQEDGSDFTTLAGFIIHHLKRLPREGEVLHWQGLHFEVVDMDERRIDKVLVMRV
jgi:putative hemolysin